jgi:hypothetical protein
MDEQRQLQAIATPAPQICVAERSGILPPGKTMVDFIGRSVINLSDIDLTPNQQSALSKGLTFCPTPWEPDMSEILQNLENFFRKMRLKSHFHNDPDVDCDYGDIVDDNLDNTPNTSPNNPIWKSFKPTSTYKPPPQEDTLEAFCKQVKYKVLKTPVRKVRWSNLSKEERSGLNELKQNEHITIKKADKGSAIVVMNTSDYVFEAERQLAQIRMLIENWTLTPQDKFAKRYKIS